MITKTNEMLKRKFLNSIPGLICLLESHSENFFSKIELANTPCNTLIKINRKIPLMAIATPEASIL